MSGASVLRALAITLCFIAFPAAAQRPGKDAATVADTAAGDMAAADKSVVDGSVAARDSGGAGAGGAGGGGAMGDASGSGGGSDTGATGQGGAGGGSPGGGGSVGSGPGGAGGSDDVFIYWDAGRPNSDGADAGVTDGGTKRPGGGGCSVARQRGNALAWLLALPGLIAARRRTGRRP